MEAHEPTLHLISFDTCPYAERTRVVLEEKELPYKLTMIDLANKPDWFLKISPRGKVPVLLVDDAPIYDSLVINEFLEEAFDETPLLSDDVLERAVTRTWIGFANDVLMSAYGKVWYSKPGEDEKLEKGKADVVAALTTIEEHLASREEGPYFLGEDFSLLDAVFVPIVTRSKAGKQVFGDFDKGFELWKKYGKTLLRADSVQAAQAEDLTEKFVTYLEKVKSGK